MPFAKKPAAKKVAAKPVAKPAVKKPAAKPLAKAPAKKTATKKAPARKSAAASGIVPLKETLNKSQLIQHLADVTELDRKDVSKVYAALENAMAGAACKKGAGVFMLPGFLKVTVLDVPAKPKRKGINPFTGEEQVFAAKPATVKVKIRPLKKLKDAALS